MAKDRGWFGAAADVAYEMTHSGKEIDDRRHEQEEKERDRDNRRSEEVNENSG